MFCLDVCTVIAESFHEDGFTSNETNIQMTLTAPGILICAMAT
jgi:hypothetical protein